MLLPLVLQTQQPVPTGLCSVTHLPQRSKWWSQGWKGLLLCYCKRPLWPGKGRTAGCFRSWKHILTPLGTWRRPASNPAPPVGGKPPHSQNPGRFGAPQERAEEEWYAPGGWGDDRQPQNFIFIWKSNFTSQVMTSSERPPPPPFTLAGVTLGTGGSEYNLLEYSCIFLNLESIYGEFAQPDGKRDV